jgi:phosphate transport system protein
MRERFTGELDSIGNDLVAMAGFVSEQIGKASSALLSGDAKKAKEVIEGDEYVNGREIDISNACAVLIALEQPVASDLRQIIAFLKVVSDIERIGDYAVHAAKRARDVAGGMKLLEDARIARMMELGASMLRDSVRALVSRDQELARKTASIDVEMDDLKKRTYRDLLAIMADNPENIEEATKWLLLSRFLERMGDHAVTICSWAIYSATAEYADLR